MNEIGDLLDSDPLGATWRGQTLVRVISLPTATGRRQEFAATADRASLAWTFFDAHTGPSPELVVDTAAMRRWGGRILGRNELGCYSSHYGALLELVGSDAEQMIILEDDVLADWPYLAFLARYRFSDMGIDYLRLFAKVPGRFRKVQSSFLDPYHHLIQYIGPALGTQAYLVTRAGAERLVGALRTIERPIDQALDRMGRYGLPNLAVTPFPVIERFVPSSIGETRFSDRPSGSAKLKVAALHRWEQVRRVIAGAKPKPRIGAPLRWTENPLPKAPTAF